MDSGLLKISSIHSYKGWEADNVILIIQPDNSISEDEEEPIMQRPELIYSAITRAKNNLFILNLNNLFFHDFFIKRNY